jgi:hypothetical protein
LVVVFVVVAGFGAVVARWVVVRRVVVGTSARTARRAIASSAPDPAPTPAPAATAGVVTGGVAEVVALVVGLVVTDALLDGTSASGRTGVDVDEPQPASRAAHATATIGAAARTRTSGSRGAIQDRSPSVAPPLLGTDHSSETVTVTSRTEPPRTVGAGAPVLAVTGWVVGSAAAVVLVAVKARRGG